MTQTVMFEGYKASLLMRIDKWEISRTNWFVSEWWTVGINIQEEKARQKI